MPPKLNKKENRPLICSTNGKSTADGSSTNAIPRVRTLSSKFFLHWSNKGTTNNTVVQVKRIQNYISSFQYNYLGKSFFKKYMRKNRGMSHLQEVANKIMRQSFPIQCVEGVFLAVVLTNTISNTHILRLPVTFKSTMNGEQHSHVVLAIRHKTIRNGSSSVLWGSLGMSRISTLMYKDATYNSLFGLLQEFLKSYSNCWHEVKEISLGLPFPHDLSDKKRLAWNAVTLQVSSESEPSHPSLEEQVNAYEHNCEVAAEYYYNKRNEGLPEWWAALFSTNSAAEEQRLES